TQADGKVVVAGTSSSFNGPNRVAVARYNPDGSPDAGFGTNGAVVYGDGSAAGVTVDSSGRILLAGNITIGASIAVPRLETDGTFDTSFGQGGQAAVHFGAPDFRSSAAGVAVDSAGHIVVAGTTYDLYGSTGSDFAVARLNADGSLDTSF